MPSENDHASEIWESRRFPVREDMRLQRVFWRTERAGWVVLCAILALALFGAFGGGPLSAGVVNDPSGRLTVAHDRVLRNGRAESMRLQAASGPSEEVTVRLGANFMEAFKIESIAPHPAEQSSGPGGVRMVFRAAAGGPLEVYMGIRPERVGLVHAEIAIVGEAPARFAQFVLP